MAARRYELTDTQWDRIKDLIPRAKTGRPPKDDRMMLNAMLWLARSGAAWGLMNGLLIRSPFWWRWKRSSRVAMATLTKSL